MGGERLRDGRLDRRGGRQKGYGGGNREAREGGEQEGQARRDRRGEEGRGEAAGRDVRQEEVNPSARRARMITSTPGLPSFNAPHLGSRRGPGRAGSPLPR